MTSIYFEEKTDNKNVIVVNQTACEEITASISCIGSLAAVIEEMLDQADLENVQNTQFRLSAIYDLCYMLREYTQSINKRFDEIISRSA